LISFAVKDPGDSGLAYQIATKVPARLEFINYKERLQTAITEDNDINHHMMSFHFADSNLNFFPKRYNGSPRRMHPNVIPENAPNVRLNAQAVTQGIMAYENPKLMTFLRPTMRKMVSGATG
jgi:hypothetical protein